MGLLKSRVGKRTARVLFAALLVALFVGTLMPHALREEIQQASHSPFALSSWAHFAVFAAMALLLRVRPLSVNLWRIVVITLALAFLSEGLQFLTPDRHPRWIDVAIDMAGTSLGLVMAFILHFVFSHRQLR